MPGKNDFSSRRPRCSFCGKTQDQVRRLIAGPDAYICDECVSLCQEIMADDLTMPSAASTPRMKDVPTPAKMKEILDGYVIGQEEAKKSLCVAVYNHYKRIGAPSRKDDVELQKSNTWIITTIMKIIDVKMKTSNLKKMALDMF